MDWRRVLLVLAAVSSIGAYAQDPRPAPPEGPSPPAGSIVEAESPGEGGIQDDDDATQDETEYLEKDLDELLSIDLEVTSASKKTERISEAAAAVFVVTQEDIRRLGARTIPEALRMVPGVEVAQINRHRWAVTARGFNGPFSANLLVLIDGRTIYTPLFAGTFWNQQDTFIDDVERIEVIRGPGATLWGANAVNGIINIITKSSKNTTGGLLKAQAGTDGTYEGGLRYGFDIGEGATARVYGRWFDRNGFHDAMDGAGRDDWDMFQGGFRVDWDIDDDDRLIVHGDAYNGHAEQSILLASPVPPTFTALLEDTIDLAGWNLVGRWERKLGEASDLALQIYWDRTERRDDLLLDRRDTIDLEFQHRFPIAEGHDFVWGLGFRAVDDTTAGSFTISLDPEEQTYLTFSAFVQDEITLVEDTLELTVGTKLSHDDFSGFEVQPSARILWTVDERHAVWAAVSRAVRTPSRVNHGLSLRSGVILAPMSPPILTRLVGSGGFDAEEVWAFEAGWRWRPRSNLSVDLALFYNIYDDQLTYEPTMPTLVPGPPTFLDLALVADNKGSAETLGAELSIDWQATDDLRLGAAYTILDIEVHVDPSSGDTLLEGNEGDSPHHRFNLRAYWDIRDDLELNAVLYWVDDLGAQDIDAYARLDLQVRWRPCEDVDLTLGAQNLLDDRHPEFGGTFGRATTEPGRFVYFSVDLRF